MVAGVARRLGQFLYGDRGARDVRVAETEVDHVVSGVASLVPQLVDGCEHIRRQPIDTAELHGALLDSDLSGWAAGPGPSPAVVTRLAGRPLAGRL